MQHRQSGLHSDINTSLINAPTPVYHQRFRRRFFVALFIGLVGLTGFIIILATTFYG